MFANERQDIILNKLNTNGSITVSELVKDFQVSIETVRRDLETMENQGLLTRVHGGAISIKDDSPFLDVNKRVMENRDLKLEACLTAINYLAPGDFIGLDSGTTATIFAELLKEHPVRNITIVTQSVFTYSILADTPGIRVITLGGEYNSKEQIFCGALTEGFYKQFHFTKSFIVPSAISLENGIQDFIIVSYNFQKYMLEASDESFIICDSTKFGKSGTLKLSDLSDEYTIITDSNLSDDLCEKLVKTGIKILR